jgi:NADH dehydrogenase FAD-containing subunit
MKNANSISCLLALLRLAFANPQTADNVKRQDSQLLDSYDFVIAGGGTSGLTVADRLTEAFPDSSLTLCFSVRDVG